MIYFRGLIRRLLKRVNRGSHAFKLCASGHFMLNSGRLLVECKLILLSALKDAIDQFLKARLAQYNHQYNHL